MTDAINDGGAAFPQISELGDIAVTSPGMTLRDWFAGQALTASFSTNFNCRPTDEETWAEMVAREAYEVADAMLAAREARQ